MTDRDLFKQALDALENSSPDQYPDIHGHYDAIEALRSRLAQPEAEPDDEDRCPTCGEDGGTSCGAPACGLLTGDEGQPDNGHCSELAAQRGAARERVEAFAKEHGRVTGFGTIAGTYGKVEKSPSLPEQEPVPEGFVIAPAWKGYALFGTGQYVINHTPSPPDTELGAELVVTLATEADKAGNRQVGEPRPNSPDKAPIQSEEMVIRMGFLTPQAVDALEDQLIALRAENFPDTQPLAARIAPQPQRKPLTESAIRKWWASENGLEDMDMAKLDDFTAVVRAIEAAHGITGEDK